MTQRTRRKIDAALLAADDSDAAGGGTCRQPQAGAAVDAQDWDCGTRPETANHVRRAIISCAVWRSSGRTRSGAPTSHIYADRARAGTRDIPLSLARSGDQRPNQVWCADITYICRAVPSSDPPPRAWCNFDPLVCREWSAVSVKLTSIGCWFSGTRVTHMPNSATTTTA